MKKIAISIFVLLLLGVSACDVMDVKPQSSILANDAFQNKEGIEKGILGAYIPFQYLSYYGFAYINFADLAADNLFYPVNGTSVNYREVDNNNIFPENGSISGIWGSAYEGINNANAVIDVIPSMSDMSELEMNKALGELYFIRALNHFNLLSYFGRIPIKVTPTVGTAGVNVPREAVGDVYAQIIADLKFAEEHLPLSTSRVRASKHAAKALLARVYLYQGNYALAIEQATGVINDDVYELIDFSEIFAEGSAESIFEIDFTQSSRNRIADYNFPRTKKGREEVAADISILDAFEPGDVRLESSVGFDDNGKFPHAKKYHDQAIGEDNVIVLRLAEMYLIRAEANAKLQQNLTSVQDDINIIRDRADLTDTDADTYDELLFAIEQERRVEFAFEGHRWFDLVRTGRAIAVLPNVTSTNQTLFPIPLDEINANTNSEMKQNDGY
jgi:hypothetical protein